LYEAAFAVGTQWRRSAAEWGNGATSIYGFYINPHLIPPRKTTLPYVT
jgi:hypothetical protein